MSFVVPKRAINHHIVPQVLQNQFAIVGDEPRIWRAKRDKVSNSYHPPERKKIAKTFVIRDYNTILNNNQFSDEIEREFYGAIDDFLGRFLPRVIEALKVGETPQLSPQALESIRYVAMQMAKRTPDFLFGHSDLELGREFVETTLSALPSNAPFEQRDRLERDLSSDARLIARGRDIRVKATLMDSERVNDMISQLEPRWAVSETKHSLILSSRMIYRIGNGGPNGLVNPKMEIWMPVAPKFSLVLLRDPNGKIPGRVRLPPNQIREINEYALENSFEIASHSQPLLNSLIRNRA